MRNENKRNRLQIPGANKRRRECEGADKRWERIEGGLSDRAGRTHQGKKFHEPHRLFSISGGVLSTRYQGKQR